MELIELAIGEMVNGALILLELPLFSYINVGETVLTEHGALAEIKERATVNKKSKEFSMIYALAGNKGIQKIQAIQRYDEVTYESEDM